MIIFLTDLKNNNMKRIVLMRHGNAENSYQKDDFDRNLSEYGEEEININSIKLKNLNILPEIITVSKANRTKQTFNIFAKVINYSGIVKIDEDLYNFHNTSEFITKYIETNNDNIQTIMFIGHNPTLSNLLQMLTGDLNTYMDTASIFVIDFDIEKWINLKVRTGKIYFSTN